MGSLTEKIRLMQMYGREHKDYVFILKASQSQIQLFW